MGLALKISDLEDDAFDGKKVATKVCSGCDPDVPGHVETKFCKTCKGTKREPLSFSSTFAEVVESKLEEKRPRGQCLDYDDDDLDGDGDLEY